MEVTNATAGSDAGATPTSDRPAARANVNRVERAASALLGGGLLVRGLARPSLAGGAMALLGGGLLLRGASGRSYLYRALGVSTVTGGARRGAGAPADASEVERAITVGKSADELYRYWREPRNLSRIMGHFAEVTAVSEDRAHWSARGPLGRSMEWDSRVVEDRPGELLRWESLEGAELPNEGSVRFRPAPGDRGTEVSLRFRFDPPAGRLGDAASRLLVAASSALVARALRRSKSLIETGEIPTTEHNPSARANARGE